MSLIKNKFLRKITCLGLSAALIYNATVPAFGQEFFYIENPQSISDNTNFDNRVAEMRADIINFTKEEYNKKMQNNAYARAEEIKKEIMGDEQAELQREHFNLETKQDPKTDEEIIADYIQQIQQMANAAKEEAKQIYDEAVQEAGNLTEIQNGYKKALADIDRYFKQEIDRVNNNPKEFLKELKAGAEESFFEHVKTLFNELMGLYKKEPSKVKEQVLELTPIITGLVNKNKEHLYSAEQKQILLDLYRKTIEEENAKIGKDKSIFTNACEIKGHCPELLSAIMGLSVLSPENQQIADGNMIYDTIENYKNTAASISVLANGISALLIMNDYILVDDILKQHTKAEGKIDYWEYLNFMAIPKHVANINGKYLGPVSERGEYWNDNNEYQNIYSDIAQILAEDGSMQALDILRKYSVEKCLVKISNLNIFAAL